MSKDFTNLLEILAQAKIEFVLVGGFAGVVLMCSHFMYHMLIESYTHFV